MQANLGAACLGGLGEEDWGILRAQVYNLSFRIARQPHRVHCKSSYILHSQA